MPEIAEVETVRRVLEKKVVNKKIFSVEVFYKKMVENDIDFFVNILTDNKVFSINRKGKYLIFELEKHFLISHLRMEGKFFYNDKKTELKKHEHVRINFSDGSNLVYHDTRKFGKMKIIEKSFFDEYFKKLGFEPFELTEKYLFDNLKKSNKIIKTLLLDQSIIAGLGNIYANEVLYAAGINPQKKGKDITMGDVKNIISQSQRIVDKAILEGGCTIKSYTSSLGVTGNYQNFLKVHMKENQICEICLEPIKKVKLDGRSTYYCENCQKL